MQFRRLLTVMALMFGLVLSLTIPASTQKPNKLAKSAKLSAKLGKAKDRKGKENIAHSPLGIAPHVTSCPTKVPISAGQTINGALSNSDCSLPDGSFYDEYTFSATTGQQFFISMSSSAFDTWLILLDPSNNDTQDDDGGGGTNSRIPPNSDFFYSSGDWHLRDSG